MRKIIFVISFFLLSSSIYSRPQRKRSIQKHTILSNLKSSTKIGLGVLGLFAQYGILMQATKADTLIDAWGTYFKYLRKKHIKIFTSMSEGLNILFLPYPLILSTLFIADGTYELIKNNQISEKEEVSDTIES